MRSSAVLLFLISLFLVEPSTAQVTQKSDTLQVLPDSEVEKLLEDATQDVEDSQLMDRIGQLQDHPLDLNRAEEEELQEIPGVSPVLAFGIVTYRRQNRFRKVEDLLKVEGVTEELFRRIRGFVQVDGWDETSDRPPLVTVKLRSRISRDLQPRRGYLDGSYAGSQSKIYQRVTVHVGFPPTYKTDEANVSPSVVMGILTKKDAGEKNITDFVAGFLSLANLLGRTRLLLGDFVVESGEGLVLWRSIGFSKGSDVIAPIRKAGRGLRPYASTDENWFFRGVAAEMDMGLWTLSTFYSRRSLSGSRNEAGTVTSLYSSGLFRTASEINKKDAVREESIGMRVHGKPARGVVIGVMAYRSTFDRPVMLSSTFSTIGTSAFVGGLEVSYTYRKLNLFVETARDRVNKMSTVAGVVFRPMNGIDLTALSRGYPAGFINLRGYGFGESGGPPQNESGTYIGAKLRLTSWSVLSMYFDQFTFPWRTGFQKLPSRGNDVLGLLEMNVLRHLSVSLQFREKSKGISEAALDEFERSLKLSGMRTQTNYRATVELRSSPRFRWRTRFEWVDIRYQLGPAHEKGWLVYQDVHAQILPGLVIKGRVVGFQTDSYDSRLYEFENDLLGTFSNPALFGKGLRWYMLGRFDVSRSIQFSLKYSHTIKEGVKTLSSGLNEITGSLDNSISAQLDLSF